VMSLVIFRRFLVIIDIVVVIDLFILILFFIMSYCTCSVCSIN